jgi:hypothetical protein
VDKAQWPYPRILRPAQFARRFRCARIIRFLYALTCKRRFCTMETDAGHRPFLTCEGWSPHSLTQCSFASSQGAISGSIAARLTRGSGMLAVFRDDFEPGNIFEMLGIMCHQRQIVAKRSRRNPRIFHGHRKSGFAAFG